MKGDYLEFKKCGRQNSRKTIMTKINMRLSLGNILEGYFDPLKIKGSNKTSYFTLTSNKI
jgi:hypothetical protein